MNQMKTDAKTTLAGLIAAAGVMLATISQGMEGGLDVKVIAGAVISFGLAAFAYFTKDKDSAS